jgi:hypothetical protein
LTGLKYLPLDAVADRQVGAKSPVVLEVEGVVVEGEVLLFRQAGNES